MQPQSLLPVQRAAHYYDQADKLREMAEVEPGAKLREQLLMLADEYQKLADGLGIARP
jgi:hypothetical protein